jgi:MerR family transcriptional regulator, redox-sensitive transcriptional activator SoxR
MVEVKRFSISEVARRCGVATSALRFYEAHGLIRADRETSGHRRYHPDVMRRVSFIRVAQSVGLSLADIKRALDSLPRSRTPNRRDWAALAGRWRPMLDERIALLTSMRNQLDECIGWTRAGCTTRVMPQPGWAAGRATCWATSRSAGRCRCAADRRPARSSPSAWQ